MDAKQTVLRVGRDILVTQGFKAITTNEIARRASISKNTLYRFFPSKDTLLEAILVSFLDAQLARWDAILEQPTPAMDRILASLEFVSEFMPQIQSQVIDQVDNMSPRLWNTIDDIRTRRLRKLKALMAEAQSQGYLRGDVDPEHWILLLTGTVRSVITPKVLLQSGLSLSKLIRTIKSVYYDGLLTDKGRQVIANKEHTS